jgi:hypothetical protein
MFNVDFISLFSILTLICCAIVFSLFCASGISKSLSSNACSLALRKLCEDATSFILESQNLEILFWISEVKVPL